MGGNPWNEIEGVIIWWDGEPGVRLWTLQWLDLDGNTICDTRYSSRKADLIQEVRDHQHAFTTIKAWVGTKKYSPDHSTDDHTTIT